MGTQTMDRTIIVGRGEYKGHALITFQAQTADGRRFNELSFGYGKAKMLLDHVDALRAFVAEEAAKRGEAR
jgi:hypothetical protein